MNTTHTRLLVAGALVALLIFLVSACGGDGGSSSQTPTGGSSSRTPTASEPAGTSSPEGSGNAPAPGQGAGVTWTPTCPDPDPATEGTRIVWINQLGTSASVQKMFNSPTGIDACIDALGWESSLIDLEGDLTKAGPAIENIIAAGSADVIIGISLTTEVLLPQIQAAKAAGIPYIAASAGGGPDVATSINLLPSGNAANVVAYIASRFNGKANLGYFGSTSQAQALYWEEAVKAALVQYPEIKIEARHELDLRNLAGSISEGAQTMLQSNPDLDAIISPFETVHLGICTVEEQLDMQVPVIGISSSVGDSLPELGSCIEAMGTTPTVSMVIAAIEQADSLIKNGTPSASIILMKEKFITAANPPASDEELRLGEAYILFGSSE